ncbi:MAG: hypothetical protein PVH88_25155 [Ignavibacteria bacterium]
MKKTIIITAIVLTTLLTFLTCGDNGVEPEVEPGRRDYEWTVDTLITPYTVIERIWGTAPDDIWAIGPGGDLDKTIYHFNGTEWENDGISRLISPLAVYGFGKNNVWLAGREGRIWRYDGTEWNESVVFKKPIEEVIGFQDIFGDSPNNIFAAGYSGYGQNRKGVIAKYDGSSWKLLDIPYIPSNFLRIAKDRKKNKYYLKGVQPSTPDSNGIFEFDGSSDVKQIYKSTYDSEGWCSFKKDINNEVLFVIGNGVYRYTEDNKFTPIFKNDIIQFYAGIDGRNEKDLLITVDDGKLYHYNGTDLENLYTLDSSFHFLDFLVFPKEIFFLASNLRGTNIILKGKLK